MFAIGTGAFQLARQSARITAANQAAIHESLVTEIQLTLQKKDTAEVGYHSFSAFKRAQGVAGPGKAWHHIVEQHSHNVSQFGPKKIHHTDNMMKLSHGPGSIHSKITGYYNSKIPGTDMLVRDYVKTLTYEEQYSFGLEVLERFSQSQ